MNIAKYEFNTGSLGVSEVKHIGIILICL